MAEKMYRIFISSTYADLKNARKQIIQSILRLGHYPICMESFVSTQEHQMDFIQEQLDSADLYIIIVGKRYGSCKIGDKCSYTEHEYEYAKQIGLPILTFVCNEKYALRPQKNQLDKFQREMSKNFRQKLCNENHCIIWNNIRDLISAVDSSIEKIIAKGLEGWTRETKYYKIKRSEIDKKLKDIQEEIYILSSEPTYNCFLEVSEKLKRIYTSLDALGLTIRDRVKFKKIDHMFYYIISKTEKHNLNPIVIYQYAQFLYEFYELSKAKDYIKIYLKFCQGDIEKARALIFNATILWKMKKLQEANNSLKEATNIFCNHYSSSENDLSETIYNLLHFKNQSEIEYSLTLLGELFNIYGLCFDNSKNYKKAITYYTQAENTLKILTNLNKEKYLYKYQLYYFNSTCASFKKGDYKNCLKKIKLLFNFLNELPDSLNKLKRLARTHQLYGDILINCQGIDAFNEYEKALYHYKECIKIIRRSLNTNFDKFKNELSWCCHKMAEIYIKQKIPSKAIKILNVAIEYREELFLSSQVYQYDDRLLALAESDFLMSKILFSSKEIYNNRQIAYDALHHADNAFFYYEELYCKYPKIFKQEYKDITSLNIKICIF